MKKRCTQNREPKSPAQHEGWQKKNYYDHSRRQKKLTRCQLSPTLFASKTVPSTSKTRGHSFLILPLAVGTGAGIGPKKGEKGEYVKELKKGMAREGKMNLKQIMFGILKSVSAW